MIWLKAFLPKSLRPIGRAAEPFRRNGALAEPWKAGKLYGLAGHVVPDTVKNGMPSKFKRKN